MRFHCSTPVSATTVMGMWRRVRRADLDASLVGKNARPMNEARTRRSTPSNQRYECLWNQMNGALVRQASETAISCGKNQARRTMGHTLWPPRPCLAPSYLGRPQRRLRPPYRLADRSGQGAAAGDSTPTVSNSRSEVGTAPDAPEFGEDHMSSTQPAVAAERVLWVAGRK
jgi:hypothetical protein